MNISLGLYLFGGFVLVLGLVVLFGGLLGWVFLFNVVWEKLLFLLFWCGWGWLLVLLLFGVVFGGWVEW